MHITNAAIVSGKHDFELNYEELTKYLAFIEFATKSTTDGYGEFILNVSADGSLNMISFNNVNVLSQSLDIKPEPPTPTHVRSPARGM